MNTKQPDAGMPPDQAKQLKFILRATLLCRVCGKSYEAGDYINRRSIKIDVGKSGKLCPACQLLFTCTTHTPQPEGYCQRSAWATRMLKTHRCIRCPECGLWKHWVPKTKRSDKPRPEVRSEHG